jgi:hypothetical protein
MDGKNQNDIDVLPKLNAFSYENLFKVYQDSSDKPYYYNIINTVALPADMDPAIYYEYQVPSSFMSWTNISYKMYGTIKLWWILCLANNISDPTSFPEAGTKLKIIRTEYVREVLSAIKQSA